MANRVAVCIGINYDHFPAGTSGAAATRAGANALRFAEADARDMAAALQGSGYDVVTLVGVEATRDAILDALYAQRAKVDADGLLLVHFSGHGQIDPQDPSTAYLLPVDADPQKPVHRAIRLNDLASWLLGNSGTALTLLDCCHSGYAVGLKGVAVPDQAGREFGQIAQNTFRNVRGRVALSACAGSQLARELDKLQHGAFTHYVLDWWRSSPTDDHNSLATHIARGLEKEHLPALVSGGVTEGLIRLRAPHLAPVDLAWRQAILQRMAQLDGSQLRILCYRDLGLDYDAVPGGDRVAKMLRLVLDREAAGEADQLNQAVEKSLTRLARDRALASRLAALNPARLRALLSAVTLRTVTLEDRDPAVTIRNLIREAELQGRFDELSTAAEAALAQPAREEAAKDEAERLARKKAEQEEAERKAREQATREEAERQARAQAEQAEAARLARQRAVQEEAERRARKQAAREVAERLAHEKAARDEEERVAREQAARLEREKAAKEEAERLAREQASREAAKQRGREDTEAQRLLAGLDDRQLRDVIASFKRDYATLAGADRSSKIASFVNVLRGRGQLSQLPAAIHAAEERASGQQPTPAADERDVVPGIAPGAGLGVVLGLATLLVVFGLVWAVSGNRAGSMPTATPALAVPPTPAPATVTIPPTIGTARTVLANSSTNALSTAAVRITLTGPTDGLKTAAWSPDGKRIVTDGHDSTAKVWDATTGAMLLTLSGHTGGVFSAAWSPDGKSIVTASYDHTAKVWDVATGKVRLTLTGLTDPVESAAWSPDGKSILTVGDDHKARVWDAATAKVRLTLTGPTTADVRSSVWCAAWSPDGKSILTGNTDNTALVWDAAMVTARVTLTGHNNLVRSVAWSPDGRSIVTGSDDHTTKVWDAATGKVRLTLTGYPGLVEDVAWSPDGKYVVTASANEAKVWDATTAEGRVTLSMDSLNNFVTSAAWSPDGRSIVTAGVDGTAKVWDVH